MRRGWDVVVVGARVAGAATALHLARAGQRVLCLDRARRGSDTVSTHALMRAGVLLLDRWGVSPAITAAGTPPIRRTVFDYCDDRVEISIKPTAGVDALYAPRRTVLDAALVDAAENAGAVMEFGTSVTGLHRSAGGRVDGVRIRRGGRDEVVRARLVVGADGRDSVVARQTAAPVTVTGSNRAAYLYSYWSGFPDDGYEWIYRPGISAGVIPTGGEVCCLFVGGTTDDVGSVVRRANGPTHAYRSMAERAGLGVRLRDAARAESVRYLHGLPPGYLRQAHGPGWALVGDAGHWLDPISTHGITSALRDADLLARALVTTAPDSERREQALREYQHVRDRLSLPLLHNADEIAGYRWEMPRLRALLRAIASAMSDEVDELVGEPAA
jgi:flavin-dependent dehydrogenase